MVNASSSWITIEEKHLSNQTTEQLYNLGQTYRCQTGNGVTSSIKEYQYIKAVSVSVVIGGVYAITRSTTADYTATLPSNNDTNVRYGVGVCTITAGNYGFLLVSGNADKLNGSGTLTNARAIAPTIGAATADDEGSSTVSSRTIGIATATGTTPTAYIFGKEIESGSGGTSLGSNWRMRPSGNTLYFEYSTDGFTTIAWTDAKIAE